MNKLETYVWKECRFTKDKNEKQIEYKLIDMDENQLQLAYDHCKHMLYNTDKKTPGRMVVLDQIVEQILNCNAERAHRWFLSLTDKDGNSSYTDAGLLIEFRSYLRTHPGERLGDILEVPSDFKKVPIQSLVDAAMDNLGVFDHSKLTLSFIYKTGIYFAPDELKELKQFTKGNTISEKLEVVKLQLGIDDNVAVRLNPRGFNWKEFTDMIHLKKYKKYSKCKYSELSSSQLDTLVKKALFMFEAEVIKQAEVWKVLMSQIEEVAKYKDFNLV